MKRKACFCLLIALMLILVFSVFSFAADAINPDDYKKIYENNGQSEIFTMAGGVIALVRVISIIVAVVMLTILGFRYMYASAADKSTIKERMIPFIIGALIIFGASFLLDAIANFARTI